jgi:DNA-binding transcriptional LysR family regulator
MPDLRQLRAFLVVAEQLSFTRAAELLHLTQQTVSQTVRDLERELGVELLERTTREVRLTPAGAALLEAGPDALAGVEAAFARAREVGAGLAGVVRVGVTPAIGPTDRADVVRALRPPGADVSVALRDVRPAELRPMLRARELDLVLSRVSGARDPQLDRAELRPTPHALYVPDGHRLAGAASARLADLDGERLLVPSAPGTPYTDMLLERAAAAGATVTPVEGRVTGSSVLLTQLADFGAVAFQPTGTPPVEGVVAIDMEDLTLPLIVLWPAGLPSAAVRRVREQMATRT